MTQMEFDWTRADREGLLLQMQLPTVQVPDGQAATKGVSGAVQKAVLRALYRYCRMNTRGEAFPSEVTLAAELGIHKSTVGRAIKALEMQSLITKERFGHRTLNHYRIVWAELALRCDRAKFPQGTSLPDARSSLRDERSSLRDARSSLREPDLRNYSCKRETTTVQQPVVVSVLEELMKTDLQDPQRTYARAKAELRLTDVDIAQRLAAWRELPQADRLPGVLANWLTKPRSYAADLAKRAPPPRARPPAIDAFRQRAERLRRQREFVAALSAGEPSAAELLQQMSTAQVEQTGGRNERRA